MAYRHVLVVCDGSPGTDEAVRAASELAVRDRAQLTIAAVVELEKPGRGCAVYASTWNDVLRDAATADLERARRFVDSPAHFTTLYGSPARALVDGARELGCDAIMLPSPPRHRLGRILTRGWGSAVRRAAACAVLQPR